MDTVKQYLKNINLEVSYQEENFNLQVRDHKGEITVVKKFINDAAGKSNKPVSGIYRFGLYDDKNMMMANRLKIQMFILLMGRNSILLMIKMKFQMAIR